MSGVKTKNSYRCSVCGSTGHNKRGHGKTMPTAPLKPTTLSPTQNSVDTPLATTSGSPDLETMLNKANELIKERKDNTVPTAPEDPAQLTAGMDRDVVTRYYGKGKEAAKERVDAILGELGKGAENILTSEGYREFLDSCSKFHNYSFNNQMLIAVQNREATRVASYDKWKEMGRQVKKGEHGISVLYPMFAYGTEKDKNGNVVTDSRGRPKKVRMGVRGFGVGRVFDVSQTEGDPLPEPPVKKLVGGAPEGLQEELETAIGKKGYSIEYQKLPEGLNGYTDKEAKKVVIGESLEPAQRVKTLAHEMGHVVLHENIPSEKYHTGKGGCRGAMEVEAESVAYVVCKENGMNTDDYSFGYVATWGATAGSSGETEKPWSDAAKSAETVRKGIHEVFTLLSGE